MFAGDFWWLPLSILSWPTFSSLCWQSIKATCGYACYWFLVANLERTILRYSTCTFIQHEHRQWPSRSLLVILCWNSYLQSIHYSFITPLFFVHRFETEHHRQLSLEIHGSKTKNKIVGAAWTSAPVAHHRCLSPLLQLHACLWNSQSCMFRKNHHDI